MNIIVSIDVIQDPKLVIQVALGGVWLNLAQMICYQMVVGGLEDSYKYLHFNANDYWGWC